VYYIRSSGLKEEKNMIIIKGAHDFSAIHNGYDTVAVRFVDNEQNEYSINITQDVAEQLINELLDIT
jgi:hypothetical protein